MLNFPRPTRQLELGEIQVSNGLFHLGFIRGYRKALREPVEGQAPNNEEFNTGYALGYMKGQERNVLAG